MRKITIAANWKMYLNERDSIAFTKEMNEHKELLNDKVIILFPFTLNVSKIVLREKEEPGVSKRLSVSIL